MLRKPAVAGQFYPSSPAKLKEMIATMVKDAPKEDVSGAVVPHAGYVYSGPVAGATLSRMKLGSSFIIMGPNHTGLGSPFSLMSEGAWQTPLGNVEIDSELAKKILSYSRYLKDDPAAHYYEHSVEVQLPFIQYLKEDFTFVPLVISVGIAEVYREIGLAIAQAIEDEDKDTIIIASSDMSHYEPREVAEKKDKMAIEAILRLDEDELLHLIESYHISMCGYGPAYIMLTATKKLGAKAAELVEYRTSGDVTEDYSSVVGYAGIIVKASKMSPVVEVAQKVVEAYVKEKQVIAPPSELPPEMEGKAGVFVSIHKFGDLRGCIGTIEPTRENIAQEIISNAIAAATRDPRFPPISPSELSYLDYSVDILGKPEPVKSLDDFDPKKYGMIVESGWRRGLLLPDLEGVDTAQQQFEVCCQKAGIRPGEPVKLYRFEVTRYK